jgi:radical SAM superfamily enzyme YgiQ (UPF0313 family)
MKKVLLINPPFARLVGLEQDYIPLSLLHISKLLKDQGFEPYIKNLNIAGGLHYVDYLERNKKYGNLMALYNSQRPIYYREIDIAIENSNPDIIGFIVLTPQIKIVNDLMAYIYNQYSLPIFCGGAGATLNHNKIGCHIIFTGGINDLSVLNEIDDYNNATIIETPYTLDNYDGNLNFANILDRYSPDGYGHVFSSVGCYGNCRFCASPAIWKRKVYFKPMESFIRELNLIAAKYNPDKFMIWDENFTANTQRLKTFCGLYKVDISWACDSRIDTLNENKIELMKQHGCIQIAVGAESGCQRVLDYLNKGIDKEKIKSTIDLFNQYGLKSKVYMIMGFPEETYEDMMESVEFIKSCNPTSIVLSLFTPYLNTSLYDECKIKGLIDDDYDESNYSHQSGNFMKIIHPDIDVSEIIKTIDEYNSGALINA